VLHHTWNKQAYNVIDIDVSYRYLNGLFHHVNFTVFNHDNKSVVDDGNYIFLHNKNLSLSRLNIDANIFEICCNGN